MGETKLDILTPEEVAEILKCSRRKACSLLAKGVIKAFAIDDESKRKVWRVTRENLENYINGEAK